MGNFSNYWDLHTLFTKIKNKLKNISDKIPTKTSQLTNDSGYVSGSYLPLSGGNMTGNISYTGTKATYPMIKFIDNTSDDYGNGIAIGGGGLTIIGGGESSNLMAAQQASGGNETMLIGNDTDVHIFSNLQSGWDYRKDFDFSRNGNLTVPGSITENGTALSSKYAAKSDIPTVNNGTLTIQKNGTNVQTFTANQSTNATANITVPTALSGLTDDATHRLVTDTEKSTWNGKASSSDITNAINALDVASVGGSGKYISAISETDGKISATATNFPTIPAAANNGTLTIQKNGTNVQTFTANQSTNATANITVPTTASDVNAAPASDVPFKFGVDSNGNYGYIKAGADTVTPFKTVGTRSSNITANGTYTASTDISKDGYSSVTVAVPNSVQTKTVTPGTSQMYVTPDAGYIGLSQVTINVANNQQKSVSPTVAAQIVRPDTGYWLNSVTVDGIPTQEKSVTPSTSAQTVTPDSGKYLTSVSVGAISTQTKSITATTNSQVVTPDSGKYLSSVTVYPQQHTETIKVSANGTTSMGDTHNYKIVDSSGAYSAGYAARAPVTLWTNPNPGSNFTAKTITISGLKNYSYVFIIGRLTTTLSGYHSIMGGFEPNNMGTTWSVDSTYTGLTNANFMLLLHGTTSKMRGAYYNGSNQITIGHAFDLASNSTRTKTIPVSIEDSFMIPEKIIGIL